MNIDQYRESLSLDKPPVHPEPLLEAMWYDAKGDWDKAHNMVQKTNTLNGSRIHAYLHRKEGDHFNARYWYTRAGREFPRISLQDEWTELVGVLLGT